MKEAKTIRMILGEVTAKEMMGSHPLSIEETATVREAVAFLVDKG